MTTLPTGLTCTDWSGCIASDFGGRVPKLMDETGWQDWAAGVILNLGFSGPNPYQFDDWRDWAERFCQNG